MSRKKKIALFAGIPVVLAASAFALMSRGGKSDLIEVADLAGRGAQDRPDGRRHRPDPAGHPGQDQRRRHRQDHPPGGQGGRVGREGAVPARARPGALPRRGRERRGQRALVRGQRRASSARTSTRPRRTSRASKELHGKSLESQSTLDAAASAVRGRQGPPALRAGPGRAGPGRAQAGARRPVEDDDLRADGRHRQRSSTRRGRDRARLAVPGGRDPRDRRPRRHGGPGRRRRERHRPARARRRGDDRGRRAARARRFKGDGHRDREQRQDRRPGHDRPEDRVRGQDRDPRSAGSRCARA